MEDEYEEGKQDMEQQGAPSKNELDKKLEKGAI